MSLINRMLQELDARRSESGAGMPYGEQIRAVPPRASIHPAWWVALVLSLMLGASLAWLFLRPAADAPAQPRYPLKLDVAMAPPAPSVAPVGAIASTPVAPAVPVETEKALTPRPDVSMPAGSMQAALGASPRRADNGPPGAKQGGGPGKDAGMRVAEPESREMSPAVPPARIPAAQLQPIESTQAKAQPVSAPRLEKEIKEPSAHQRSDTEYRKGLALMQQGKAGEALQNLEQALQFDSRNSAARQALIAALIDARRHDEAMKRTRESLAQDPAQPALAMVLARLQVERAELGAAIETLERSLAYGADKPDYLAFLAALEQRDRRHKEAVSHYLAALRTSPQNGAWWMGLGISLQAENRSPEAREAFKRAKGTNTLTPELTAFVDAQLAQLGQ